ncbi:hypothetical protein A2U01_0057739, partial [Trifolium medium]|nr:hypothetical protein [Trifolium medium]
MQKNWFCSVAGARRDCLGARRRRVLVKLLLLVVVRGAA